MNFGLHGSTTSMLYIGEGGRVADHIDASRNKLIIALFYFGTILKVNLMRVSRCLI